MKLFSSSIIIWSLLILKITPFLFIIICFRKWIWVPAQRSTPCSWGKSIFITFMESYTVTHFSVSFVIKMPNIKLASRCWTWKMINSFYSFNTSHLHDFVVCMVIHFFYLTCWRIQLFTPSVTLSPFLRNVSLVIWHCFIYHGIFLCIKAFKPQKLIHNGFYHGH